MRDASLIPRRINCGFDLSMLGLAGTHPYVWVHQNSK